jgi:hypothetical protein
MICVRSSPDTGVWNSPLTDPHHWVVTLRSSVRHFDGGMARTVSGGDQNRAGRARGRIKRAAQR